MVAPTLDINDGAREDAERERQFWQQRYEEFLRLYPDQFVAVHDGAVVATAYDLRDLVAALKESGLEPHDVWVRFLESRPQSLIL